MNAFEKAVSEAEIAKSVLETRIGDEKRAAAAAIDAKYRDELRGLAGALGDAKRAARAHIDATASHPWDGKRVFVERDELKSSWSRATHKVRYEGIVEVVRTTSKFPENMSWRKPALGNVIIRKLKKNGAPALTFFDRHPLRDISNWSLVEDAAGQHSTELAQ